MLGPTTTQAHYHYIQEKVLQEEITLASIGTREQVTDIFTKGLGSTIFFKHREALGIVRRSKIKRATVEGEKC